MNNPWLDVPLADYEGHMALPGIAQAQLLSDEFERVLANFSPVSVAVIGCACGNGLDVLHQKEQVKRIRWAGFKLPIEIPLPGRLVLGVHQQCTNPGNVSRLCSAQQRIFEQCFAKPSALVLKVHCKPGQNHHRHGVLWNAFGHTGCRTGRLNATNRQAVETNDRARMAGHVGLRAVGFLVDERKALQKLIQCALATIEGLNGVRTGQFAN